MGGGGCCFLRCAERLSTAATQPDTCNGHTVPFCCPQAPAAIYDVYISSFMLFIPADFFMIMRPFNAICRILRVFPQCCDFVHIAILSIQLFANNIITECSLFNVLLGLSCSYICLLLQFLPASAL